MSYCVTAADLIARKYADDGAEVVRAYQSLSFTKHIRLLESHMGLRPGARVLDIGCGTGALLVELAQAGAYVVGVDTFEEASGIDRDIADARLRERGVDASILQASAASLPFASGAFDVAISIGMLEHIPPEVRPDMLREMFRTVRPGGNLFLIAGPTRLTPLDQHIPGHPFSNWLSRKRKAAISRRHARRQFLAIPWAISRRELHAALPDGDFVSLYAEFFGLDGGQPLGPFRASPFWVIAWLKRRLRLHRLFAVMGRVLYILRQEHCHILAVRKYGTTADVMRRPSHAD